MIPAVSFDNRREPIYIGERAYMGRARLHEPGPGRNEAPRR